MPLAITAPELAGMIDRRYTETRGAAPGAGARSEALVRRYLGAARKMNHDAQSFGGSTGGLQTPGDHSGLNVLTSRAEVQRDSSRIFKEEGRGALGARASSWEARQLPDLL